MKVPFVDLSRQFNPLLPEIKTWVHSVMAVLWLTNRPSFVIG